MGPPPSPMLAWLSESLKAHTSGPRAYMDLFIQPTMACGQRVKRF